MESRDSWHGLEVERKEEKNSKMLVWSSSKCQHLKGSFSGWRVGKGTHRLSKRREGGRESDPQVDRGEASHGSGVAGQEHGHEASLVELDSE